MMLAEEDAIRQHDVAVIVGVAGMESGLLVSVLEILEQILIVIMGVKQNQFTKLISKLCVRNSKKSNKLFDRMIR